MSCLDLYVMGLSAPCRSVMLLTKSLGLDVNFKTVDLRKEEQMKPDYVKMNPQHTVPTLDDNGFHLWESRAILTYLATQYGGDRQLCPSEPRARAVVDQRLYFDMGTLYERFGKCVYPVMFGGAERTDPEATEKLKEALSWLEGFISDSGHVAGDHQTVADFAIVATVSTIEATGLVDFAAYPKVQSWLHAQKKLPGYAVANGECAVEFGTLYKQAVAKAA